MSDEVISLGGGLEDPIVHLTAGEDTPVRVYEGGTLESSCFIEEEEENSGTYYFQWVSFGPRENRTLSRSRDLRLTNVYSDSFRDPIYCVVTRNEDGEVFEKQINIEYCKTMHEPPLSSSVPPLR